jgi:hypothetical protein
METRAVSTAEYAGRALPSVKPVNPSCFGNIEDVAAQAQRTAELVEGIVARLCGVEPSGDPSVRGTEVPTTSLFDSADRHAREIRGNLGRIEQAMARLEKHLP